MLDNSQTMSYNFEIETLLCQFIALLDGAVIFRYDKNEETLERKIIKKIEPRYTFGTKDRVFYFLNNKAKNYTLPVITSVLTGIKIDPERYSATYTDLNTVKNGISYSYHKPVPIILNLKTTIITKYITDLYQIFSRMAVKFNPYSVFSWFVPHEKDVSIFQELRSKVKWDGTFGIEAKEKIEEKTEELFTATMNFEIYGWTFSNPLSRNRSAIYDIGTSLVVPEELLTRIDYSFLQNMDSPLVTKVMNENERGREYFYNNPREFATTHLQICKTFLEIKNNNHLLFTKNRWNEIKKEIKEVLPKNKEIKDVFFFIDGYNLEHAKALLKIEDREFPLEEKITFLQNTEEKNQLFPEKNKLERKEKEITDGIPLKIEIISKNQARINLSDIIDVLKRNNINDVDKMDIIVYNSFDYDTFTNAICLD